jgi:hypothetical protein
MPGRRLPDFRFDLFGNGPLSNHHRSVMKGVTIQVLPLRGDMARMRQFINSYLNFVDDDYPAPFYFKPAMPYVMLEVIDYPFLAVTSENMTVLSQHEVGFTVPLECYAIEDGERVFVDYASCTPFLYLDVQPTIISGRDVFGLPKIAVQFHAVELPMRPGKPGQILDMRLRYATRYGDDYRRFIEIFSDPPRYRAGAEDIFTAIPKAWARWFSISNAMWEQMTQLPTISGYERTRDLDSMRRMTRANRERMFDTVPLLARYRAALGRYASSADIRLAPGVFENISLKQFRDAEYSDAACYQSVVRSAMYLDRMNDAGPLYDPQIGDPTGGINIKLYYTESQPLINSFGLRVEDETDTREGPISTLKPDFPFWENVDLSYALGTNLYWRGRNTRWSGTYEPGRPTRERTEYITFGGGALQELPQRFVSPNSFAWIIALPLSEEGQGKLQTLCKEYLANDQFDFEPCFPFTDHNKNGYVFMLVYHLLNSTEGFGVERDREVEFVIPVKWSWKRPKKELIGYGVFPLYAFSDSESVTITQSEVFGLPTLLADIDGIILDEMTREGAVGDFQRELDLAIAREHVQIFGSGDPSPLVNSPYPVPVLNLKTSLLKALYSGAEPQDRMLVQMVALGKRKEGNYSPPDSKSGITVVPWVGLKQVVDSRLPQKTSYQAIVMDGMKINKIGVPQQLVTDLEVRIHRYAAIPMVDRMGLQVASEPGEFTTIDKIKPDFALWLHFGLEAKYPLNAYSREGTATSHASKEDIAANHLDNIESFEPVSKLMINLVEEYFKPTQQQPDFEPLKIKLSGSDLLKKLKDTRGNQQKQGSGGPPKKRR